MHRGDGCLKAGQSELERNWTKGQAVALPTAPKYHCRPMARPTILVIDDDPSLLALLERTLATRADVMTAADATQGLSLFRVSCDTVDLILLDIGLPGMSGYEALAEIQLLDADVPVAVITGLEPDVERLPGVRGILAKPFRPEQVLELVDAATDG